LLFPNFRGNISFDNDIKCLDKLEAALLLEQGNFKALKKIIDKYGDDYLFSIIISQYYSTMEQREKAMSGLKQALLHQSNHTKGQSYRAAILGEIGEHYEELENYEAALLYFRRAINTGVTGTYLASVSYPWHYMLALIAFEKWDEVIHVMRDGQKYMWSTLHPLSTLSQKERIRRDFPIRPEGALFLGGWGLGDEILRLSILRTVMNEDGKYGLLCDPRIKDVAQRSLPDIEFMSNSRMIGPFKVEEEDYWRDREGVTAGLDFARTTTQVLERSKDFPDIALTEDLMYHYMKSKGSYKVTHSAPLLTPKPELIQAAKNWLSTLPGTLNVAISWRSGVRSFSRDKSYTDITTQWGDILQTPNINFINIQYSDTSEEVQEVRDKFGVEIYAMPDIDLKDDVEDILALSKAVDLVISPCTASLEMAGAVNVKTWSLSTTSPLSDYWRIDKKDRKTDVFFPSIEHITLDPYGTKEKVLEEVARRLDEWQKQITVEPSKKPKVSLDMVVKR